jgi:small subunit ribosomal protein S16
MLEMRFLRSGRRNQAFFRVVLTESSKPPKSGFIKVLGWFNPHTKETSLQKEEILSWLKKGAQPSNKLSKILSQEGIKHKMINFVPSAKKAAKTKDKAEVKETKTIQEPKEKEAEEVIDDSNQEASQEKTTDQNKTNNQE